MYCLYARWELSQAIRVLVAMLLVCAASAAIFISLLIWNRTVSINHIETFGQDSSKKQISKKLTRLRTLDQFNFLCSCIHRRPEFQPGGGMGRGRWGWERASLCLTLDCQISHKYCTLFKNRNAFFFCFLSAIKRWEALYFNTTTPDPMQHVTTHSSSPATTSRFSLGFPCPRT